MFQIFAVCLLASTMLGADSSSTKVEKIGHKLVCQCGCGQILMECNHVGCPVSPVMIEELRAHSTAGVPENGVLTFFIQKYGPIVLAAPMRGGFDNVAWIVPIAALVICLLGVVLLMRAWRRRAENTPEKMPTQSGVRERIRRETEQEWIDQ